MEFVRHGSIARSLSKACKLNTTLWNGLVGTSRAKGTKSPEISLASFIMVWAAMDGYGSITTNYFSIIIPDDAEMKRFFCGILDELHESPTRSAVGLRNPIRLMARISTLTP